ncbi:pilus assembly protein TadG-related protein [Aeromicrobium fastidiosum]|uniref:Putative Flp pilus-assembly TadG-like N-terminal domain-containing protein n=1 Tax=Aeromicrobium fastidiosum TaxID=52699 RepID=A0A641ANK1_9ACTN|nr:pilus assembly protein TadG-related protein [Aeromicrobium fastidiosum]KAA1379664.1 hypothetical protein ESP62_000080 [Aeromicrobium fastidiosum]MBP2389139.1 putative membrane protein [Aeromicrobium fastidiosum]
MTRRDERDERGAILVMAVLLMTVVLTFTAFAVDLGTQRVARRDMQSLADSAAMDLARQLKGRTASVILADPKFAAVKTQAVEQNKTVGRPPTLTVALGTVSNTTGVFTPVSGGAVPTAVQVIAATSVGFAFAPGDGKAARPAVATSADPTMCFSASSSELSLNSSTGALGPLLDLILKTQLNVLSPAGLLTVKDTVVPLADLAVALGVGTPQAVLATTVSTRDFVLATATALSKNGYTVQAAALQAIGLQISGGTVDIGKILNLETANSAGLSALVNVFDLVTAAVFASNGTNALNVKNLGVGLPGAERLLDLTAIIVEPPQIACGKAGITAKSAQVKVHVKSTVDPLSIGAASVVMELDLEMGRGEATLKSIACGSPSGAVITAKTGAVLGVGTLNVGVLQNLGLLFGDALLSVKSKLTATGAVGGPTDLTFTPPTVTTRSVSGSGVLGLAISDSKIGLMDGTFVGDVLGAIINPLLGGIINTIINPLVAANGPIDKLLSALIYPVFKLLGVQVAKTDVTAPGSPDCSTVKLVG